MVELSVVIPVYGCVECLRRLHQQLSASLATISAAYEIIFIDDCSPDQAWSVLSDIAGGDTKVRIFRLSRNFGQHAAITAGLANSTGRWVIVMDCDLQDPPEEIERLYRKAQEGYEIVFARRKEKQHSFFRRVAARAYVRVVNFFSAVKIEGDYGSFSILSRKVVDAFLLMRDRDRHYLFILNWLGFHSADIEYEHAARFRGQSSYSLRALIKHAVSGIFFQTTVLLRWIVYLGFWVSMAGVLLAAFFMYQYFVHSVYPGYTSLAVLILVIGGFIISSTGIAGLYIGKIFEQVKGRPLYVIDKSGIPTRDP